MLKEQVIQVKDDLGEMPSGIYIKYISSVFGDEQELSEARLEALIREIRNAEGVGVILGQDPDMEEDYMSIEIDQGLICFQYIQNIGTVDECFYSSFNPAYLDSEEESPINCSDGQSIILMRYTMQDPELAAKCVEYFARTGKLYPGMDWLKSEWA